MENVDEIIAASLVWQREALDLVCRGTVVVTPEQVAESIEKLEGFGFKLIRAPASEPRETIIAGRPGAGTDLDPHRVLEMWPKDRGLHLALVTQRQVDGRWEIDEAATTEMYLTPEQVEDLRWYLNHLKEGE